jgi:hypothetical protein
LEDLREEVVLLELLEEDQLGPQEEDLEVQS